MKNAHLLLALILGLLTATVANGQSLNAIKADMKERLPQIEKLWKQGLVGEDNQGYLASRGQLSDAQKKLMEAENKDRKAVYAAIAQSAGSTVAKVGAQRALQIAKRAANGLWLQAPDGTWYKK